jgi:hypothetical protein
VVCAAEIDRESSQTMIHSLRLTLGIGNDTWIVLDA